MGNFLQTLMSSRLDNQKRESLCEKHLIPENTRLLDVPKVNEEIWRVLSLDARSKDVKLQKIQSNCLRAIVPVVRAIDHLVKNQSQTYQVDVESIVTLLVDSLVLISCASSEMNSWRRDSMKKELNHEYTDLCSQQNPVTKYLFRDNITEQLNRNEQDWFKGQTPETILSASLQSNDKTQSEAFFFSTGLPRRTNI